MKRRSDYEKSKNKLYRSKGIYINLKVSAWAAIISAIILVPSFILGFLMGLMPENKTIYTLSIIVTIIGTLISFPTFFGFIRIAKINKLKFLEVMMYVSLIITIIFNILIFSTRNNLISNLGFLMLLGIVGVITGIAVFKLESSFGGIMTAIGVMYVINGILLVSVIFVFLIPLTGIASNVLEAIFFFRASEKYD